MENVATQLAPSAVEEIAQALTQALAETAVVTTKAQNFHWNVTGMAFGPLHDLFGDVYEDHFEAQDDLAERIRALDLPVDGRLALYLDRAKIDEATPGLDARAMIAALLADQQTLAGTLSALAAIAERNGDLITQDMAIERGQKHEKFAWMLRAHLAG